MPSNFRARMGHILLWSVISAAFIGPGTVTTAAKAGASQGMALAWALVFSTLGCLVLQEAAARLSIAGGKSLGQALTRGRRWVVGAVVFGCMAYEAGNLLGAYSGLDLVSGVPREVALLLLVGVAAGLLAWGRAANLSKLLGALVLVLGLAFLLLAFRNPPPAAETLTGMLVPSLPEGAGLLVIGLVGTTIVPYNLFLGNGIGRPEDGLAAMRFGLTISVVLGGVFSLAIMAVATGMPGAFSFENLATYLQQEAGAMGPYLLAGGLFVAGLTSSLTAPLAAGLAVRSILPADRAMRGYHITWFTVLAVGLTVGLLKVQVVPVIIMAQALNGFVLPLVAGFLFWAVNQPSLLGEHTNGRAANILFVVVLTVSGYLGLDSLLKALDGALGTTLRAASATPILLLAVSLLSSLALAFKVTRRG